MICVPDTKSDQWLF